MVEVSGLETADLGCERIQAQGSDLRRGAKVLLRSPSRRPPIRVAAIDHNKPGFALACGADVVQNDLCASRKPAA